MNLKENRRSRMGRRWGRNYVNTVLVYEMLKTQNKIRLKKLKIKNIILGPSSPKREKVKAQCVLTSYLAKDKQGIHLEGSQCPPAADGAWWIPAGGRLSDVHSGVSQPVSPEARQVILLLQMFAWQTSANRINNALQTAGPIPYHSNESHLTPL